MSLADWSGWWGRRGARGAGSAAPSGRFHVVRIWPFSSASLPHMLTPLGAKYEHIAPLAPPPVMAAAYCGRLESCRSNADRLAEKVKRDVSTEYAV